MNVLVFCLPVVLLTPILLLMTWFASRSWIAVTIVVVPVLQHFWLNWVDKYAMKNGIWAKVCKANFRNNGEPPGADTER